MYNVQVTYTLTQCKSKSVKLTKSYPEGNPPFNCTHFYSSSKLLGHHE